MENLPICYPHNRHWFWHGEQILGILEAYRPKVCVELGTWKGCSAIAVARLVQNWSGRVVCIDVWEQENVMGDFVPVTMAECQRNIDDAGVGESVLLIRARTEIAARYWPPGTVDYLYVDAGHSFEACTQDLEAWWPNVKVGGLIAGDDYADPRCGVTQAWDEFEKKYGQYFERPEPLEVGMGTRLIWGRKR